jgi:hypothetical protein
MFTRVRFVFLGVALLCSLSVFAQALSGVVTDQKSRERLISATVQLSLFDFPAPRSEKQQKLDAALDNIRAKYGKDAIKRGRFL